MAYLHLKVYIQKWLVGPFTLQKYNKTFIWNLYWIDYSNKQIKQSHARDRMR